MVRTAICAGLHAGTVLTSKTKGFVAGVLTADKKYVLIHPGSVNARSTALEKACFVAYNEIAETKRVYVRDTTHISPLMALLAGSDFTVDYEAKTVKVGPWSVDADLETSLCVKLVRRQLDRALVELILSGFGNREGGDEKEGGDVAECVKLLLEEEAKA